MKGEKERFGEQLASTGPLLKVGVLSQEVPCRAAPHETAVTQPCSRCPSRERPAAGAPGAPPRGQCVYSPALPLELMPKYSFCQCPFRRRGFHPPWEKSHVLRSSSTTIFSPSLFLSSSQAGHASPPAVVLSQQPCTWRDPEHANHPPNTLI